MEDILYLYVTKDLTTNEYKNNISDCPERTCAEEWSLGRASPLLLTKTLEFKIEDVFIDPKELINLIRYKNGFVFEYGELFDERLPNLGLISTFTDKRDSRRIKLIGDIRKEPKIVKGEAITIKEGHKYLVSFKCEECKEYQVHNIKINVKNCGFKKYTYSHDDNIASYREYLSAKINAKVILGYITI